MNRKKYNAIYERLNKQGDIVTVSRRYQVSRDVLSAMLSQKIVRETKKKYHIVKENIPKLSRKWSNGESILKISNDMGFPPVMMMSLMLQAKGMTRKQVRKHLEEPEAIKNPRLGRELADVLEHEFVYSPEMTRLQKEMGNMVEEKVGEWLKGKRVKFIVEEEARGIHTKTPDCLLNHAMKIDDKRVKWIECKATFGDDYEIKRDYKKQLSHYIELFGPGMVVYWFGFLRDKELEDILIKSRSFFG